MTASFAPHLKEELTTKYSENGETLPFSSERETIISLVTLDKNDLMVNSLQMGYKNKFQKGIAHSILSFLNSKQVVSDFFGEFKVPESVTFTEFRDDGRPKQTEIWKLHNLSTSVNLETANEKVSYLFNFKKGFLVTDFSTGIPRQFNSNEVLLVIVK